MDETLKQFNEKLALDLKARFSSPEIAVFVKNAKASGDDRSFEVVMSTSDEDRQGDSLDQSNWDLKYYDMNPVVLWAHNYGGFPIGVVDDIKTVGDETIATGHFAPEGLNPEADMACALYREKILRAVSPGYIQNDDGTRELLEMSFCPVPAGRHALSLRQVGRLGVSTRDLVTKGFFYEAKETVVTKSPQAGDHCELDDGTPGVLSDDPKNPGEMVCVPERDKSQKQETEMDNELTKSLKAEHERHAKAVGTAIDEFEKKAMADAEGTAEGKAHKEGDEANDNSESEKAIDEFKDALDGEHEEHLKQCMKAVGEYYETMGRKLNDEKSIDEFKSAMKSENLKHIKAFNKAIDEFKADQGEADGKDEREQAFKKCEKAMGDELDRHTKAHMDMCKAEADRMGEGEDDGKGEKLFIAEAVSLGIEKSQAECLLDWMKKSGRAISAKNKEKLKAILEKMESHHNDVIASIKELMGSDDADEGKETPSEKDATPNQKSRSAIAASNKDASDANEFETYMFLRNLLRTVNSATKEGLEKFNKDFREKFPNRR